MSNKKRKGSGDTSVTLEQAQRQLAKGDTRQALKDAKVLFRRAASEAHRRLLEQAYAARVEQLQQMGLPDQARAAFDELQSLPPRSPDVLAQVARLQLLLGLAAGGGPPALETLDPEFLARLADDALVHPQRVAPSYSDLLSQARQVREALEAIEHGEDSAATVLLKDIAQKSPFADWKLLARGLSAHYAGDAERRDQNWDRLSARRPPYRIAQSLRVAWGLKQPSEVGFDTAGRLRRLEFSALADAALRQLKELASHSRKNHWNPVLRGFRTFAIRFANTHKQLIERITEVLWIRFAHAGHEHELRELMSFAPAPMLDPNWNQALALCAESRDSAYHEDVEERWEAYLTDLPRSKALRESERNVAAALVNLRLAAHSIRAAGESEERSSGQDADPTDLESLLDRAETYFQAALEQYPQLHDTYIGLATLRLNREQPELAVPVFETLLKYHPDDLDAIRWLANYFVEADQPDKAEPYVQAAVRLRPREAKTQVLLWNQRLGMVRHYTRRRKFDRARQEIESLATQPPAAEEPWWMDATRAVVEFKARNPEQAQFYLDRAIGYLQEPTPIWLVMHALAVRYRLDKTLKNDFAGRFKAAVKGRCTSQTAGQVARFLNGYLSRRVRYSGFVTHQRALRKYLERCRQVRWEAADLAHVCEYLVQDSGYWKATRQLEDFAARGRRSFPQDPRFAYYAGVAQVARGPFGCDIRTAISEFESALKLNQQGESRLDSWKIEKLKENLSFLRDQLETRYEDRHTFGSGSYYDDEEDEDDFYEDDEDDYDDEDDGLGSMGPMPCGDTEVSPEMIEMFLSDPRVRANLERMARAQGMDAKDVIDFAKRMFLGGGDAAGDAGSTAHEPLAARRRKNR